MELADLVMSACVKQYEQLPKTGKPKENEWTIMSGIVGCFDGSMKVLSLGTGSKCIGRSFMSPAGDILNDSHSEVIARRGFLRYVYNELIKLSEVGFSEIFNRATDSSCRFCVKDKVKFYFATTASPCGDASIITKTAHVETTLQNVEDSLGRVLVKKANIEEPPNKRIKTELADIHRTGAKCLPESDVQDPHLPGVDYHRTGAVRTKPGRGDPTASVSCSDKLTRWNAVGIQGALLSILVVKPIYMEMIVIGGGCPYSEEACDRAINQRINNRRKVPVSRSAITFPDMKSEKRINPSPNAIIWCANGSGVEVSVNGRRQGTTKKNIRKKSSRTSICKKELFILFAKVIDGLTEKDEVMERFGGKSIKDMTYLEVKSKALGYVEEWERVRDECLKVWTEKPRNLLNFTVNEMKECE